MATSKSPDVCGALGCRADPEVVIDLDGEERTVCGPHARTAEDLRDAEVVKRV
ncbi:hypothetical protein [Halobaculum sp. EA56]|uniref:hypothetical protein n=1 Tax=Halobaculum sp. EA56 TaxID=3421648 RepID=UPI003EC142E7